MALGTVVTIWPNAREREAIAAAARRRMGELEREVAAGVRPT
jgi:hypothetical protein